MRTNRFFLAGARGILLASISLLVASCGTSSLDLTNEPTNATRSQYAEYIEKNAPSEDAFVAVQRLAFDAIEHRQWADAVLVYSNYKPKFPGMRGRFDTIIGLLTAPDDSIQIAGLGDSINTLQDEFLPVITVDGKKLYFCRNDYTTGDDVMVSDRISEEANPSPVTMAGASSVTAPPASPVTTPSVLSISAITPSTWSSTVTKENWSKAVHVPPPIFSTHSEAPTGVSPDGNRLLLFGNYYVRADTSKSTDSVWNSTLSKANLFYSDKLPDGRWGPVKAFPPPINSGHYESDTKISSDGKELFFVSDRPGGIGEYHPKPRVQGSDPLFHGSMWGNTDIYVSLKQPDGSWGPPINLGSNINTPYAERSPFLHPDGKTLYFSSEGHAGLGMLDIFKSTRLSDTSWTEWSTPVNLGKEINTAGTDWGYVISTDGRNAYMAISNRTSHQYDIKRLSIPQAARPSYVATITGHVTDEEGHPLSAEIKWDDLETAKNVGELSSDPTEGSFFIALPLNHNYGYYAEKPGYFPVSRSIDLRGIDTAVNISVNIVLVSIKSLQASDSAIRLNNIFFDFDKATLQPESFPELDRLLKILKETPDVRTEIDAHTDNKGTHAYNVQLSKRRAQSVVDYLIAHGVDTARLSSRGYAETRPVAPNITDEGRALNRRVEFRFPRDSEFEPPIEDGSLSERTIRTDTQ